ncbi:MAG TPA: mechanosensitive ion channel domain-containing protein [Chitinophagaceae bacterium]|nr:mechanosensitive ion channel domain-containing protein [Chitinophagaceae bacterium]
MRFLPCLYFAFTIQVIFSPARAQTGNPGSSKPTSADNNYYRELPAWKKRIQLYDTSAAHLISRIEDINSTMNDINLVMASGFDTGEIASNLSPIERRIKIIRYNISSQSAGLNLTSLSLIDVLLDESINKLKGWQNTLFSYSTELVSFTAEIRSMTQDSILKQLPVDSSLRFLYNQQLGQLRDQWKSGNANARKALFRINILLSQVSDDYFIAETLRSQILGLTSNFWHRALGDEYGFIGVKNFPAPAQEPFVSVKDKVLSGSLRVMSYYLASNEGIRVFNFILGILFFCWILVNRRKFIRRNEDPLLPGKKLSLIQGIPVLAALVFMFNINPLLEMHPPPVYTVMCQLLLTVSLTILLGMKWPRKLFACWIVVVCLFELQGFGNLFFSPVFMPRFWFLGLELFSMVFGFVLLRAVRKYSEQVERYIPPLVIIYIFLNLLGLLFNIFGRVTLSALVSSTAINSFFLAISLMVFIRILLEAVFLQLEAARHSSQFLADLKYERIESRLKGILTILLGIFWFINLTQNLNIYDDATEYMGIFLGTIRHIGSTSFSFGNILVFFFVIWMAYQIQKYLAYFFGVPEDEILTAKKNGIATSLLLIRLVVLVSGFLLGVAASGLPVDKITVVIGALGVGVGLGLQGMVNQLVSGVVLAIERPIHVGDAVEIGGQSGRVKKIGIRSCHIITPDGADIIVPNAEMISQNLINWTVSNNHIRTEISVKIEPGADPDKVAGIIRHLLDENKDVMKKPEPQLLFSSIDQSGMQLQVLFWVEDINNWIQLKSDMLKKIFESCNAAGIKLI